MTLLERLNDGGEVFLTHTTVGGQAVLRVAIGSPATTRAHVERVWALLREGHDWLAADFAAAAAEQAAARAAEQARAEEARAPGGRDGRRGSGPAEAEQQESARPDGRRRSRRRRRSAEIAPGDDASDAEPSDGPGRDAVRPGHRLALDEPTVEDPAPPCRHSRARHPGPRRAPEPSPTAT